MMDADDRNYSFLTKLYWPRGLHTVIVCYITAFVKFSKYLNVLQFLFITFGNIRCMIGNINLLFISSTTSATDENSNFHILHCHTI